MFRDYHAEVLDRYYSNVHETSGLEQMEQQLMQSVSFQESRDLEMEHIEQLRLLFQKIHLLIEDSSSHKTTTIYGILRRVISHLGESYRVRYEIYDVINNMSIRSVNGNGNDLTVQNRVSLVDVLLEEDRFNQYYSAKMDSIGNMLTSLQESACDPVSVLDETNYLQVTQTLNKYIHKSSRKMRKQYDSESGGGGCLSLIYAKVNSVDKKYLCFSGLYDSDDVEIYSRFINSKRIAYMNAIQQILTCNEFQNFTWIKATVQIPYYVDQNRKIRLEDVICNVTGNFQDLTRMFSCCERKFMGYIEGQTVASVDMYTRFSPCELCTYALSELQSKCNANVIHGFEHEANAHKQEYDSLAIKILNKSSGIQFQLP